MSMTRPSVKRRHSKTNKNVSPIKSGMRLWGQKICKHAPVDLGHHTVHACGQDYSLRTGYAPTQGNTPRVVSWSLDHTIISITQIAVRLAGRGLPRDAQSCYGTTVNNRPLRCRSLMALLPFPSSPLGHRSRDRGRAARIRARVQRRGLLGGAA